MKFRVIELQTSNRAQSPVRVVEQKTGREVGWINRYLDREYVRRLADKTLRIYAHNLLHFVRWWERVHHTSDLVEGALSESTLQDYVRFQSGLEPRPCVSRRPNVQSCPCRLRRCPASGRASAPHVIWPSSG